MNEKYLAIIDLPHHSSISHPHMSNHDRAAQFAPFAALTGYDTSIKEAGRITLNKLHLDVDKIEELNEKLFILDSHIKENPYITISYYQKDNNKNGGHYLNIKGYLKKIDKYERHIELTDKKKIAIEDIMELDSELFS